MKIKQMVASVGILVLAALCVARADDTFPSRQISLIVPNAPGGGMDTVARLLGKKLSEALSQPIIVENRPGGAENIGINAGAKAAPDGYTLLLSSNSITINPSLFKHLNYDASKDLLPIGKVTSLPMLIVCSPSAPYKTLFEFIAYAKGNPGKLSYGSPGTGTPHHLAMELLKSAAGIDILHVPYKGTAPGLTDLLGDTIPLLVTTVAPVAAYLAFWRRLVRRGLVSFQTCRPLASTFLVSGLTCGMASLRRPERRRRLPPSLQTCLKVLLKIPIFPPS
jgi:tripartite-type tricarboxylate transporter receptor subunit TctC